jgi:predicted Zn-dependent protease
MEKVKNVSVYDTKIKEIIRLLKDKELDKAYPIIKEVISQDVERPEGLNLLGAYYELLGNIQKAVKLYRVAYFMNQTYKPADENLTRITQTENIGHNIVFEK